MKIPALMLRQLYTFGSLRNLEGGFGFSLKNRLSDATVTGVLRLRVGDRDVPLDRLRIDLGDGRVVAAPELSREKPARFSLKQMAQFLTADRPLEDGTHEILLALETRPFGRLELKVTDAVSTRVEPRAAVPPSRAPVLGVGRTRHRGIVGRGLASAPRGCPPRTRRMGPRLAGRLPNLEPRTSACAPGEASMANAAPLCPQRARQPETQLLGDACHARRPVPQGGRNASRGRRLVPGPFPGHAVCAVRSRLFASAVPRPFQGAQTRRPQEGGTRP